MQTRRSSTSRAGAVAADRRRGATVVEFATVVPVFFLFMFAAMEFAHLNTLRNTAHNAAYEAARAIVVPGADAAEARAAARYILGVVGVTRYDIVVTPETVADDTQSVTVTIDIPYQDNAIFVPWFTGDATVHSEATLKTERYGGIQVPGA